MNTAQSQPSDVPTEPQERLPVDKPSAGRLRKVGIIAVTVIVTCLVTVSITLVLVSVVSQQPPATPRFPPPKAMTVILYPAPEWNRTSSPPANIPAEKLDYAWRLVTPDTYYRGGVNDWITPLMGEVILTHEDGSSTRLLVRWSGHNPALISVDGRHYFYGRADKDIHDGGVQLIRLARE
jgi:hypothetical protein